MAPLEHNELTTRLEGGDWRIEGDAIVRDLELEGFTAAIAMVNRIAALAEEANHHPDLLVHGYKRLRVTLSTHSEGGVTENDLQMAERIDALV
ncbi:MAG: 4a-hydroxytetrahydrobiopterin dehydratase [Solirubrobacteraceae bacterium MAG38_C4-C5]|nr:4a-hydroxytetrahydrobiopterin dehydratase [Candidatus Siliceabacter maunaloa]